MRCAPALTWTLGDAHRPADPRLLPLLETITVTGSLAAAVQQLGLSYRAAWGLLRDYEQRLGVPLVELERGRGATLATAGQRLVQAHRSAMQRFAPEFERLAVDLGPVRRARAVTSSPPRLRLAASHDLALAALRESTADNPHYTLELSFMGSVPALEAFHAGAADIAGFHLPGRAGSQHRAHAEPFRHLLRARRDRLLAFVEREQGLMLTPSEARHVRTLRDVAARQLLFVNRQRGSGTRLIIDALLRREGLAPAALRGYATEEFTHGAVAATIASGGAQAGFGLRAAAQEYGVAFVPLVRETYYLAVRAAALRQPALAGFIAYLQSPAFAGIVRALPGYRVSAAGKVLTVDHLD